MDPNVAPATTRTILFGGNLMKVFYNLFNVFIILLIISTVMYNYAAPRETEQIIEVKGLGELNRKVDKLFAVISGLYEKVDKVNAMPVRYSEVEVSPPVSPTPPAPARNLELDAVTERLDKLEKSIRALATLA